jgi:hypothetical protein
MTGFVRSLRLTFFKSRSTPHRQQSKGRLTNYTTPATGAGGKRNAVGSRSRSQIRSITRSETGPRFSPDPPLWTMRFALLHYNQSTDVLTVFIFVQLAQSV